MGHLERVDEWNKSESEREEEGLDQEGDQLGERFVDVASVAEVQSCWFENQEEDQTDQSYD